ncbi:Na+/H+ antiporter NhaA, partial [Klebsiella pneumoniae]|nr:Na+/H+ antiporter NhaA [Klebsiella pneumoniae]
YTQHIDMVSLAGAAVVLLVMFGLGRAKVDQLSVYLALAAILWLLVFRSGIHATIAGVAAAATIPITKSPGAPDDAESPLHRLE